MESSAKTKRAGTKLVVRLGLQAAVVALFLMAAFLGTGAGLLFAYRGDLPRVTALDEYRPSTITRLLARDGRVVGEFATERRVVIGYDDIAPVLRQAIIASEDAEFETHFGLSVSRILVTAVKDLVLGQRFGASTITQQVARDLFLQEEYLKGGIYARTGRRGLERKIKEMFLAMQIERRYTKPEILTFYANQMNLGHGAYGVEAGARMYFGKSAKDLTLDEAATIAAIIQTPARLSPFVNPDRTLARRNNYVLLRMTDEGFITEEQARDARQRPIALKGQPTPERSIAPYFVEDIRKRLEQKFGADALYQAGLRVQTTLDAELQEAANAAVDRGLRRLDKRRGYRRPARNVLAEKLTLAEFTSERWARPIAAGDIVPALVTAVAPGGAAGGVQVRIGSTEMELPRAAFAWTRKAPQDAFRVGDVIEVEVRTTEDGTPATLMLEQEPRLEAALVAIDNQTGQVRAMVGGFSFARSKFNRATQARRQVGSLFKPILYSAALDHGYTPISVFVDEPVSFDAGAGQPPYAPLNYDRKFEGAVTLRRALEQSRNIPAVKAMAEIGPATVMSFAKRFGFPGNHPPYLALALGAAEAPLVDMTSAYSAFPNQGVRMAPYSVVSISDRQGNPVEEHRPEPHESMRADVAFVMTNLLRGVVQRGTAAAANALDWPVAGKTGTVDNNTDAWFAGFDADITVGVWVGYDEKRPIGSTETGASAALPIWIDFMRAYIDKRGDRKNPPAFEAPGNIVFVALDSGITEAFISGTQPQPETAEPTTFFPEPFPPFPPATIPPATFLPAD
jgi:penicillin-binding protein 1A